MFQSLRLVGGTGLALQLGHRKSVDIDLFGKVNFEYDNCSEDLAIVGKITRIKESKYINIIKIGDIKVDFVNYKYPWIGDLKSNDGIRLASIEDIAAMKLNAITGRGTKKDFVDLYFLLKLFSFEQLFSFYEKKYDDGNVFLVRKSIPYFRDAERNEMPEMLIKVSWGEIKSNILSSFRKEGY
jgi:hypothetical protein